MTGDGIMKKTRNSIIISAIMAIAMCVSLIAGATFAFFTSESQVNIAVTSGNVEVSATVENVEKSYVDENGETVEGKLYYGSAEFEDGKLTLSNFLPKDTVKFNIKVVNNSTVTVKYRTVISVVEDNGLFSSLDITLDGKKFYGYTSGSKYATLNPDEDKLIADVPVVITLPEDATCNNTSCTLSYTVEAVQGNVAVEDFPEVPEDTIAVNTTKDVELLADRISGSNAKLTSDVKITNAPDTLKDRLMITEPTTLQLNAKIVTPDNMGNNDNNFVALVVRADTTINAGLNGGIDTGVNGAYAINVMKGANLTVNGGTYYGGGTAVQVQEGTLTITGGTFACEPFGEPYGYNFLINCVDSAYKNGTAKVIVKGGKFKNFNPADNTAEGKGTNFVADGYTVVTTKDGDDIWYEVVSESFLQTMLSFGYQYDLAGNLNVTADLAPSKTLTVSGNSNVTINATGKTISNDNKAEIWSDNDWSLVSVRDNASLTLVGGTYKAKENDCYAVDVEDGANLVIKDGTFIGNIHAVYVYEGTATIEGGFFSVQQKYSDAAKADGFVLNCYDANRANGTAKIIVKGGTFVNFNPADCWAEGEHTNFLADGYKVESHTQTNGDIWYTVVKA